MFQIFKSKKSAEANGHANGAVNGAQPNSAANGAQPNGAGANGTRAVHASTNGDTAKAHNGHRPIAIEDIISARFDARKYDIVIHLIGRPGDGKTVLEVSLAEYLFGMGHEDLRDRVQIQEVDKLLSDAYEQMRNGEWPSKTPPNDTELISFTFGDLRVGVVCHAGEILRFGGAIMPERIEELFGPGNHVFTIVINGWRYHADIAGKAYPGLIATLQAPPLNHNLLDAARIAYELLFGLGTAKFEGRRIDHLELALYQSSRIEWHPPTVNKPGRFTVRLGQGCPSSPTRLFRALKNYSDYAVESDLDINTLRQFARRVPGVLTCVTRLDLLEFVPTVTQADFNAVFDDLFGYLNDYWVSQRVQAKSVTLTLRADPNSPTRVHTCTDGGKALFQSIVRTLARTHAKPMSGGGTGGRVGRFFRGFTKRSQARASESGRLAGQPGESVFVVNEKGRRYRSIQIG
jgi:hypothetical protein